MGRHKDFREWLIRKGCDAKKIEIVPISIDVEKFKPGDECSKDKLERILFVGRLTRFKGVDLLVEIMPEIVKEISSVELWICGDGPLREYVDSLARKTSIRKYVKFLGRVPRYKLVKYYQASTLFCLPSYYESFGIVNLEAMACGLPVVSTNVGATPDVVKDGECGILIPPGDREALKEALLTLLSDEGLRSKFSKQARSHVVRNFSHEVITEKILRLYEKVIS